jgi:hypothetical protein
LPLLWIVPVLPSPSGRLGYSIVKVLQKSSDHIQYQDEGLLNWARGEFEKDLDWLVAGGPPASR